MHYQPHHIGSDHHTMSPHASLETTIGIAFATRREAVVRTPIQPSALPSIAHSATWLARPSSQIVWRGQAEPDKELICCTRYYRASLVSLFSHMIPIPV